MEGKDKGKRKGEEDETTSKKEAKKLLFVVFHPMVAARENGVTIPGVCIFVHQCLKFIPRKYANPKCATQAGEEGNWLKDNMEYFKDQADAKGDEDFAALVKEVEEREDLKALLK